VNTSDLAPPESTRAPAADAEIAAPRRRWNPYWLSLWGIIAIAVIPRAARLTSSLWNDETLATRTRLAFSRQGLAWMLYDNHSHLYNVLMLFWNHIFGESELSLRALPFICSLAAIAVAARIAREVAGRAEAVVIALMMALSGASVYYSHEARAYSFIVLMGLLMVHFLLRYMRTADKRDLRWFVLFSFLCSISHLYTMIFVLCLTAMLVWRAAEPHNIVALVRLALLQIVLAVPFYFFVVLTSLFTKEYAYQTGFTEAFGGPQIARLFSFILFGYAGLTSYWLVHVLALAVFVAGLIALLRRLHRGKPEESRCAATNVGFSFPAMKVLFVIAGVSGLAVFAALSALRWLVRPDLFASLVPNGDHGVLLSQMVGLVSRTAVLYVAGYVLILIAWWALGKEAVAGRLVMLVSNRDGRPIGTGRWKEAIVLFPLLGFVPVIVASHLLPCYSTRYMMVLLPFLLLPTAVAVCGIPAPWRVLAVAALAFAQVYSLAHQGSYYDTMKPDYRSALRYLYDTGRNRYPIADTAAWEADNLNKYYSRRFRKPELRLMSLADVPTLANVSLLVPDRFPLTEGQFAGIQAVLLQNPHVKKVRFRGIAVYELDRVAP
jgi:uncharacterized membrane protein